APDTDVIVTAAGSGFEEVRVLKGPSAPSTARWKIRRGSAVASLRVREGRVEALDAAGVVQLSAAPMLATDAAGTQRLANARIEGDELVASLDVEGLTFPIALDPAWTTAPSMAKQRNYPTAQVAADGTFLVVGGSAGGTAITQTEQFDPKSNAWTNQENQPMAKSGMASVRLGATILVVAGGDGTKAGAFNNGSKAWTLGFPSLANARTSTPALVAFSANQALVFGSFTPTAESITIGGASWVAAGNFTAARIGVFGAKLPDGRVIAMGGSISPGAFSSAVSSNTTEIWSPTTKTWTAGPTLVHKRTGSLVVTLPTGALLVIGGYDDTTSPSVSLSSCELWDPTTKTFKATGATAVARYTSTATLLPTGKVLVAGGSTPEAGTSAELYDPATGKWTTAGTLTARRGGHVAGLLPDGRVILAGGNNASTDLSTADFFTQAANGAACTAAYECTSGNCVDGTCCSSASCATGEVCTTGSCAKKGESACTKDADCASGHCVDSVCCDTACDQQCQACDQPGLIGKCSTVTGLPHGTRAACTGTIVGGDCGIQCDGKDPLKCNFLGASTNCGMRSCKDGTETTVGVCDGAGRCGATPKTCDGYACDTDSCKTTCANDMDCQSTHQCTSGKCVSRGATCSEDGSSAVEASGKTTNCAPFVCKAGGCVQTCTVSTDCISGDLCDASGKCVPAPDAGTDSGGGCAMSNRSSGGAALAFLALSFFARRRRRAA
ncbi:MAG: Kelch repeat-containing protein, partial [Polyangiales bacterium]